VWFSTGITRFVLVCFFGAYAFINGVLYLILAARSDKGDGHFWGLLFHGLLGIAAGLITFFLPGVTALVLVLIMAWWAILNGILEIIAAVRLRKHIKNEWLLVLAGIASVAFGVPLLLQPAVGAIVLVWWIGSFALVFGVLLIVLAFRMRSHRGAIGTTTAL
jgi:uncharacterized membrane protein HdeD (DUF308 family)